MTLQPSRATVTTTAENDFGCTVLRVLILAFIALILTRLAVIVPDWIGGVPPRSPGQYMHRLYFSLGEASIMASCFISLGTKPGPQPMWRHVRPWLFLAFGVVMIVLDVRLGS
jgi:hypothetical protein